MGNIFSFLQETFFESEKDKEFRICSKYDGISLDTIR